VVRFKVEDPDNAAAADLGPSFEVQEEIYVFRNFDKSKVHVVFSLDNGTVDASRGAYAQPSLYFANAWGREYGDGRVFYSALGHHDAIWHDPRFQRHIVGCVKWAAKLDWQSDPVIQDKIKAGDTAGLLALAAKAPTALRTEPVRALGSIDSAAAAAALANFAKPGGPLDQRTAAVLSMGRCQRLGTAAPAAYLADPEADVRRAAVVAIGRLGGPDSEKLLLSALSAPQPDVRQAALDVLAGIDTPSVTDALLGMLKSQSPGEWKTALAALMGRRDERISAALLAILQNPPPPARGLLPTVIARLAPMAAGDEVFAALKTQLGSPEGPVREAAVRALAGSGRPEIGPLLAPLAFDRDNGVAGAVNEASAKLPSLDLKGYMTPYITDWQVMLPFGPDRVKAYPPETQLDLKATCEGQGGTLSWQKASAGKDGVLNFLNLSKVKENAVAYAWAVIHADEACQVQMRLGSDDGCKVWLNGELVHNQPGDRGLQRDGDRFDVKLVAGDNPLLVKVEQGGGDWALCVRLGSPSGKLGGLSFKLPGA
jgi:hypothetical protein